MGRAELAALEADRAVAEGEDGARVVEHGGGDLGVVGGLHGVRLVAGARASTSSPGLPLPTPAFGARQGRPGVVPGKIRVHIVHIFARGAKARPGGGPLLRGLGGFTSGVKNVAVVLGDFSLDAGVEGGVDALPARGVGAAAARDGCGQATPGHLDQLGWLEVVKDVEIVFGGWVGLVVAPPAVPAGTLAQGGQADVVAATDLLGGEAGEIVGAGLGPGLVGSDAIGVGHACRLACACVRNGRGRAGGGLGAVIPDAAKR